MKYLLYPLILAGCCFASWTIYDRSNTAANNTEEEPREKQPIAVDATVPQQRKLEDRIELVGTLEPLVRVNIRARMGGYIKSIPFDVGDPVDTGTRLIKLDDDHAREMVESSTAAWKVAQAQLKAKQTARQLAAADVARLRELAATGASTDQEIEQSQASVDIAAAEVELEEARVEQAQSDLQRAELSLRETEIKSPLTGIVAERPVDMGDLAQPDEPLLTIVDVSKVRTVVHVSERDYLKIEAGQTARILIDAVPDRAFVGTVIRKAPVLDESTRTAPVQIELDNRDGTLKPGMYARVSLVFSRLSSATVLPASAVIQEAAGAFVYRLSGTPLQADYIPIKIGIEDGGWIQVLDGLDSADRIVTLGNRLLRPKQEVTLRKLVSSPVPEVTQLSSRPQTGGD